MTQEHGNLRTSCDVAVVGAGPAGIATADTFQREGLDCLLFDAGCLAQGVARYPIYMEFFSTADLLELGGFPLVCPSGKPTRREYLAYLSRLVKDREIPLRLYEKVERVEPDGDRGFIVHSVAGGETRRTRAGAVVLSTGALGTPNPLGCPGEDLDKVHHYYSEVHPYVGTRVVVAGNGNSACEAALSLWRAGVDVEMAIRSDGFGFVKYWVRPDIENRIEEGSIKAHFETVVQEVRPHSVVLKPRGGEAFEVANDFILALIGYQPDTDFLRRCGVEVDPEDKRPRHDKETLETEVPGLFVAGVIAAGNISAEIFIENSRDHGRRILPTLKRRLGRA